MVGMAPMASFKKDGDNYTSCGWYMSCRYGNLYSQRGAFNKHYVGRTCNTDGTVIGVQLKDGELSFSVIGVDMGVAFRALPNADQMYPAFDMYEHNCEFEFL